MANTVFSMWNSLFNPLKINSETYCVYDSVFDIDETLWSPFAIQNSYLSISYLKAFENGMSNKISFKYIVFFDDKKTILGIAMFQIVGFMPIELLQNRIPCDLADRIKTYFLETKILQLLLCGNLYACGENGFAHSENISTADFLKKITAVIKTMYPENENQSKISFALFKEFWPNSLASTSILEKKGYTDFAIDYNMILPIEKDWKNFNGYLANMNTKYRTRAKNVLKSSKEIEKRLYTATEIENNLPRIQLLYNNVIENADYNLGVLNAQTFVFLKENLKGDFVFNAYYFEEQLVGFSTAFVFDGIVDANFVGIDYEFNKKHKLYQRQLFDFVDLAIEKGQRELRLGRTAETIKSVVGAVPVAMKLYARHRNCISTNLLKPLISSIKPNEAEIRKPFKE